jgi:biotin carboxylase
MNTSHVVFVDSTLAGLLAFKTAKDMGCRVTFVEPLDSSFLPISTAVASRIDPHLKYVDEHIKLPTLANGELTRAIRQLAEANPVDAIMTTSEAAILPVAQAAQETGLLTPGRAALEQAVFKDRCREALEKAGLRSPKFQVLSEDVRGLPARSRRHWWSSPPAASGSNFQLCARPKQSSRTSWLHCWRPVGTRIR